MTSCCPNCGFSLARFKMTERDGWSFDPTGGLVSYRGRELRFRPSQRIVLRTLADSAYPVSRDVLHARISSPDTNPQIVAVTLTGIRRRCRAAGVPVPFRNVLSAGWQWTGGE